MSWKEQTLRGCSKSDLIELLLDFRKELGYGFKDWISAQDEDVLDAFPAQELFRAEGRERPRDWLTRWQGAGGQLYDGRMIASKGDQVWAKLSSFGIPYPPFEFNSGMWVRDVDRDEAERLGVIEHDQIIPVGSRSFEDDFARILS